MSATRETKFLIDAAADIISARYRPDWHVVGAALVLGDGTVVNGVHIDANVGRIAVCAEAIALGRAITEYGRSDVEMIASVYRETNGHTKLVAPCGMCRELLIDYAPDALVVMPCETGAELVCVTDLLPAKYSRGDIDDPK